MTFKVGDLVCTALFTQPHTVYAVEPDRADPTKQWVKATYKGWSLQGPAAAFTKYQDATQTEAFPEDQQ